MIETHSVISKKGVYSLVIIEKYIEMLNIFMLSKIILTLKFYAIKYFFFNIFVLFP